MFKISSKKIALLCVFVVCIYTVKNVFALSRLKLGDKIHSFTLKTTTGE